jgi:hypothetical protein
VNDFFHEMKQFFGYVFSFCFILFGGSISAFAFFDDISGIPAEGVIGELTEAGIISTQNADGSERTEYRPNDPINRAEFLKFAFEAFNMGMLVQEADVVFQSDLYTDIDPTAWYFPYVVYSKINGIAQGYPNGEFRPAQSVTQAEALKLLLLISDIQTTPDGVVIFPGISKTAWYLEFFDQAESRCILLNEDSFLPDQPLTRAEMAILTDRVRTVFFGENLCEERRGVLPPEEAEDSDTPEEIADENEETTSEEEEIPTDEELDEDSEDENGDEEESDDNEEEQILSDDIPDEWQRYSRDVFEYSFAIPELWFWNEDNGEGDVIAYVEAGEEEEITDENRILLLEIVKGDDVLSEKKIENGEVIISLPRNDETYFRVSGPLEYSSDIEGVADSILLFSEESEMAPESEESIQELEDDEDAEAEEISSDDALLITIADDKSHRRKYSSKCQ